MLDFLIVSTRNKQRGVVEIYPKFIIKKSKDLMIRGGDFYAVWREDIGLWSTNEEDLIHMIDEALDDYARTNKSKHEGEYVKVLHMWDAESGVIDSWHKYCQKQLRDNYSPLDENLIFMNQETTKTDYASKTLNYPLDENGSIEAYDELMSIIYDEDERHKIEWAIGAIVTGDSKNIQKFVALYGPPGSGKSTILNIIQMLFDGYCSVFDADSLGSASDTFNLEQFRGNPLVAICHDADLSKIEKNTKLNSLVSHERMIVNEKHRSLYSMRFNSFLIIGTNKPVRITDAKSGLIRRLIDARPSGSKISISKYNRIMKQVTFELGAIAFHCKQLYMNDTHAYDDYKPVRMMGESNDFYNFVQDSYQIFKRDDGTTLKAAWSMYKLYCEDANVPYPFSMRVFRVELSNYFKNYEDRVKVGDEWVRSYFSEFRLDAFEKEEAPNPRTRTKEILPAIQFKEQTSNLDILCASYPAQYSTDSGIPREKWIDVKTTLSDIDTSKLHYLKVPDDLIVIDFDITDEHGVKSFEKNLEMASKWPKTYSELSRSGGGIHLHYIYNGDATQLSRIYADNIEIKVFTGNSSLRRLVTKCNNEPINTISSGLPIKKGDGRMINFEAIANEKALRTIIRKNLNKEYHPATKPSIDFIFKVLEDAYENKLSYDVSDLFNVILAFAASSTNQSEYCLKLVTKMKLKSETSSEAVGNDEQPIVFYDVEVFENLFVLNWKPLGSKTVNRMINPSSKEVEALLKYRLVGFNCRRYDNHIVYGKLIGYNNLQLYNLSQKIINEKKGRFREAWNISYTDIYDYSSKKQSLKKWEIELGIHHQELGLPWNKPVPEHLWVKVAEYCDNDVIASEAVWNHTKSDFKARQILADLAGMSVNSTTNSLTTRIIFGNEKNPKLEYYDLSKDFPGYKFVKVWNDKTQRFDMSNMYRGIDVGFGGYNYSEPGMYGDVALLDIASMHPNSAILMNVLGEYTPVFKALVDTRVYIKHGDYDSARELFNNRLVKYLKTIDDALELSTTLKIPINSIYGLTAASFNNAFRDPRNENNIVALRGALFMKTLQDEIVSRGYKPVHIKTDSIKIPDATPEIISFCMDFAKSYGYLFEHEATFDRMCLVNESVFVARHKTGRNAGEWTATGLQFKVPYVFKTCFSKEPIIFEDLCEVKEVKSAIYLNMNDEGGYVDEEQMRFVGRVGSFCPIKPGCGGGELVRTSNKRDGSVGFDSVTGAKGYRWLESEEVFEKDLQDCIDLSYYNRLVDNAIDEIDKYGDFEWFVSDEPYLGFPLINGRPDYNVNPCQIDNPFRQSKLECVDGI